MTDKPRPTDDEIIQEVANALGMDGSEVGRLKLSVMETHEKADSLLDKVRGIGHEFSVKPDEQGDVFVNVAWLATLLLMEGEQVMRGHGGCPDHMRVVDWIETTILAAQKNVGDA